MYVLYFMKLKFKNYKSVGKTNDMKKQKNMLNVCIQLYILLYS